MVRFTAAKTPKPKSSLKRNIALGVGGAGLGVGGAALLGGGNEQAGY